MELVTRLAGSEPLLLVESGSSVAASARATLSSVPVGGTATVTVRDRLAPLARVATAGRGRGDRTGARETRAVAEGCDCRPGDNAPGLGPCIAGGDEGDAGGQRIADHDRGSVRGPVVRVGNGVAEVVSGIDGGRPGLG